MSGFLSRYREFLRNNSTAVAAVESIIYNVSWFLPDRFSEHELPLEVSNSLVGLVSVLHECLLSDAPAAGFRWAAALSCIRQVEVLIEMASARLERSGTLASKYSIMAVLELIKALARTMQLLEGEGDLLMMGGSMDGHGADLGRDQVLGRAFRGLPAAARQARLAASNAADRTSGAPDAGAAVHGTDRATADGAGLWWHRAACGDSGRAAAAGLQAGTHAPPYCGTNLCRRCGCSWRAKDGTADAKAAALAAESGSAAAATGGGCAAGQARSAGVDSAGSGSSHGAGGSAGTQPTNAGGGAPGTQKHGSSGRGAAAASADCCNARCPSCKQHARSRARRRLAKRLLACGEALAVVRPLLYVLLLRRWGKRSWLPWLLSGVCEALSHVATRKGTAIMGEEAAQEAASSAFRCSGACVLQWLAQWRLGPDQAGELSRRRVLLLLYLLRDPFYATLLSSPLKRMQAMLGSLPIVASLSERGLEILEGVQQYYSYTSGS